MRLTITDTFHSRGSRIDARAVIGALYAAAHQQGPV
jgi:hypothetical protein